MNKQFFRIGEVSEILGVKTSVLRFWESEFRQVNPKKSATGQRYYSIRHVDFLKKIKNMLYVEKYTIEGAKKRLASDASATNGALALSIVPVSAQVTISSSELAPVFEAIFEKNIIGEPAKMSRDEIKHELNEILRLLK